MHNEHDDAWLQPMLEKRGPDTVRILIDLIIAGLAKGAVSANDVIERELDEPNIIGGTFKILPRFGFYNTKEVVKAEGKKKHGRWCFVWRLDNPAIAQHYLSRITKMTVNQEHKGGEQLLLGT